MTSCDFTNVLKSQYQAQYLLKGKFCEIHIRLSLWLEDDLKQNMLKDDLYFFLNCFELPLTFATNV